MAKVLYYQTLQRTIEVEVTDDELASLRQGDFDMTSEEGKARYEKYQDARQAVVDKAIDKQDEESEVQYELVSATCTDEQDEELFEWWPS